MWGGGSKKQENIDIEILFCASCPSDPWWPLEASSSTPKAPGRHRSANPNWTLGDPVPLGCHGVPELASGGGAKKIKIFLVFLVVVVFLHPLPPQIPGNQLRGLRDTHSDPTLLSLLHWADEARALTFQKGIDVIICCQGCIMNIFCQWIGHCVIFQHVIRSKKTHDQEWCEDNIAHIC